jgi:CDP-glucose 4,6-dehydratase
LNVTTDKVYFNDEREIPFKESDILDGNSPYENSKSCSELVTNTYRRSFDMPPLFTARAGNVIGGGDFSDNRIIPDCFRAISKGEKMIIRNPDSVRPFQLVSECLYSYLLLLSKPEKAGSYNIGPLTDECINTETLVKKFYNFWNKAKDRVGDYEIKRNINAPSEAKFLQLNSSLFRENYSHSPKWNIDTAIEKTAEWYKAYLNNENKTFEQIREIFK